MPKPILGAERRTNPLVWFVAIICAFLAVAVIITGAIVFAIYMIYQPKTPNIHVVHAHLVHVSYDKYGYLSVEMDIKMAAENHNSKVHASFSEIAFLLLFHGAPLAQLRALPFEVPKNSSRVLDYPVKTAAVPLDAKGMEEVDGTLKGGKIGFLLKGHARTRWRVGGITSVKLYTHLNCNLWFFAVNGSSIDLHCKSTSG